MRKVPEPLYSEVFGLSTELVDAFERGDADAQEDAFVRLRQLHSLQMASRIPDPFVSETLADFTDDPIESASLYRAAIEQCAYFPSEPLHTKQIGLASSLIGLGEIEEARGILLEAIQAARNLHDTEAIAEAEELLNGAAS